MTWPVAVALKSLATKPALKSVPLIRNPAHARTIPGMLEMFRLPGFALAADPGTVPSFGVGPLNLGPGIMMIARVAVQVGFLAGVGPTDVS